MIVMAVSAIAKMKMLIVLTRKEVSGERIDQLASY